MTWKATMVNEGDIKKDIPMSEPPESRAVGQASWKSGYAKHRRQSRSLNAQANGPGEEWMLTYMDTVTLLVTLFVLLLSLSTLDEEKYQAFAEALSIPNKNTGILPGAQLPFDTMKTGSISAIPPARDTSSDELVKQFRDTILDAGLTNQVNLKKIETGVQLEINENVSFPVASAELTSEGKSIVENLTPVLLRNDIRISVEGHTDNVPIHNESFKSNWELSGARASAVVHQLITNGIPPEILNIVGYADTQPQADNSTADGRAKNRRVNLIVNLIKTEKE